MKTRSSKVIIAGFAAVISSPAFALEPPVDNAPPPPQPADVAGGQAEPANLPQYKLTPSAPAQQPKESAAFLGVVSAEVPPCLAEHVGLKAGQGVIVRAVVPDGPADKAGIGVNDVITAVGGENVGNPLDITNRIMAHKAGDTVAIDVIHKGESSKLNVTLVSRPKEVASLDPQGMDVMPLESIPRDMADQIRKELEKKMGPLDLKLGNPAMPRQMEDAMREMQQRMKDAMRMGDMPEAEADPGQQGNTRTESSATFRMMDNDGSVEVRSKDGSKEVTVRDHSNNVLWSGPWNSDADKTAAPAEVRSRMEGLRIDGDFKGNGLRFHSAPGVPANPDN